MSEKSSKPNMLSRDYRFYQEIEGHDHVNLAKLVSHLMHLQDRVNTLEQRYQAIVEAEEGETDW